MGAYNYTILGFLKTSHWMIKTEKNTLTIKYYDKVFLLVCCEAWCNIKVLQIRVLFIKIVEVICQRQPHLYGIWFSLFFVHLLIKLIHLNQWLFIVIHIKPLTESDLWIWNHFLSIIYHYWGNGQLLWVNVNQPLWKKYQSLCSMDLYSHYEAWTCTDIIFC